MALQLELGVKSDPIEYRYSHPWLFRLLAEEGIKHVQIGTHFELYQLPDEFFVELRQQAENAGVQITSMFTAHRELGGFFRQEPGYEAVARKNFERLIEVGGILGAESVGSNPGAVMRDLMGTKEAGIECYLKHMKELMHFAHEKGVKWLTIEPMSCLAEPPTLPDEVAYMGETLNAYHEEHENTVRVGMCSDIAHGYIDQQNEVRFNHIELFEATLPYLYEVHLKNTDQRFNSTFGFTPTELEKGIVDVAHFRDLLLKNASRLPVERMIGFLEIGGPKLGRDYSDHELEEQLRGSLRHLKEAFLVDEPQEKTADKVAAKPAVLPTPESQEKELHVEIAPSMMCVDPLNFEAALRQVERLGVDMLHMDIMDASFVPNMPMGVGILPALREKTDLPLDVHLMVDDNDFFIDLIEDADVDRVSVHVESCLHLDRTLGSIEDAGAQVGATLNPSTPFTDLEYVLERLDYILLMTVNPGFAGQVMTPASLRKISDCRRWLDELGFTHIAIQVDGNVSFENIPKMVAAGADNLVAGTSSIFHKSASWEQNMVRMKSAIHDGLVQREALFSANQ